jgi:hypothetical protein
MRRGGSGIDGDTDLVACLAVPPRGGREADGLTAEKG